MFCELDIAKGGVRFKYWVSKSTFEFLHPACTNQVPPARRLHSKACLRYQKAYGLGHHADGPLLADEIEEAFLLLP